MKMKKPIEIEKAKDYYLVPLKDQEALFYLGNADKLQQLRIVLPDKKVVATSGVSGETCYLLLDMDENEIKDTLEKARNIFKKK